MSKSVLFVCAFNRGRSVASEYMLRKMLKERDEKLASQIEVTSAGIILEEDAKGFKDFGLELPENVFGKRPYRNLTTILQKRGIDISSHRSRELTTPMVEKADVIILSEEYPPFRKTAITTSWPSARDKTFTFREFVEAEVEGEYLVTEDPYVQPFADDEFMDFPFEYWKKCAAEIEECLSRRVDKFVNYLQLG
jgi:protein-tyrosine-phosphatase